MVDRESRGLLAEATFESEDGVSQASLEDVSRSPSAGGATTGKRLRSRSAPFVGLIRRTEGCRGRFLTLAATALGLGFCVAAVSLHWRPPALLPRVATAARGRGEVQLSGAPCSRPLPRGATARGAETPSDPCKPPSVEAGVEQVGLAGNDTAAPPPKLFCFSVTTTWGYEIGLVRAQFSENASIFGCDAWAVFSIDPAPLGSGVMTTAIPGPPASWRQLPGQNYNMTFNTNVFLRAWDAIHRDGEYQKNDWVVKVDVDAVFFADRLREVLAKKEWSWATRWKAPVYVKNCWVYKSMQGPLEIMSKGAVDVLTAGVQTCKSSIPFGDLGEDQFLDKCLHKLGVQSVSNYEILDDFYCDHSKPPCECADQPSQRLAFHPCKSMDSYFQCQRTAARADGGEAPAVRGRPAVEVAPAVRTWPGTSSQAAAS